MTELLLLAFVAWVLIGVVVAGLLARILHRLDREDRRR